MIRFILSCFVAFALIGSAPTVAAVQTPSAQQSDCSMATETGRGATDQEKVSCCTSDCTMAGTASLTYRNAIDLPSAHPSKTPLFLALIKELRSFNLAAADPPPRISA